MTGSLVKVLIIVENLPVPFDRRVWMEATTLRNAGYQVSVICPTGKGCQEGYEQIEGVHVYRHALPPEQSSVVGYLREYSCALWSEWKLAWRVRRDRGFDVIQACNPPDLIFLIAAWFKLFHGTKFIFDQHDLGPEMYESKFRRRGFFWALLRIAERLSFMLADMVISPNESYKEVAMTRGRRKQDTTHVVRSGPNVAIFRRVPENPAHRRGHRYLVGYLGVMAEFDGVDHLVKAVRELVIHRNRTDIQFCLIGAGPMLNSLRKLARELGIGEHIEFTGRISDGEMIERISSCDLCVGPDPLNPLNDKCTMNKILEYMALERPIVQYDLLEGRRSAGGAALYAQPNNIEDLASKIETLLADPYARARMGRTGLDRMVDLLEWRHQAPKLLEAYRKALNGRPTVSTKSASHSAETLSAKS
jgi:glycosyltransferase involved in cell wall biosynthesis